MAEVRCIWEAQAELGEGVTYFSDENAVWWVDILGQRVFRIDLTTGAREQWATPETVAFVTKRASGGMLLLLKSSLCALNRKTGEISPYLEFETEPDGNRFNDGCVDAKGRLWLGSMDFDFQEPTGFLYRVEPNKQIVTEDHGYVVLNGPAFSPDGATLYANETMKGQIFAFDCDPDTGSLDNKRLFAQVGENDGLPDGLTVDSEGGIWVALVTAGKVRRYLPDGTIEREIAVPSPTVTSVCLGGADMKTLFITTGRILMDEDVLAKHPSSGSLFAVDVEIAGQQAVMFGG